MTTTFDFSSGTISGAVGIDPSGPSATTFSQQFGGETLRLTADAGRIVSIDENDAVGDDPALQGRIVAVDGTNEALPMPRMLTLTLSGKAFDLSELTLLDPAAYYDPALVSRQLKITTSKGSVTVTLDGDGQGQHIILPDAAALKGVTSAVLSDVDGKALYYYLDDIVVANVYTPVAPSFDTPAGSFVTAQNAGSASLASYFGVSDPNAGETLTWTVVGAPQHGSLTFGGASAPAGTGSSVAPGTLTYAANAGYAGTDSITVQVSDGISSVTKRVDIHVVPTAPGRPVLDPSADTGVSNADNVTGADRLKFVGSSATGDGSSIVRVFIDENGNANYDAGEAYAEATVAANGTWSVANLSTAGLDGSYKAYAYVTSIVGGERSSLSSPLTIDIDHTAPATTFGGIALSSDTGASAVDFETNVAAQTIGTTLSAALQAGDRVQGSVDNGAHWSDITSMVDGTSLTWTGATLVAGGRILLRVVDQHGNAGAATPQDYTLDQTPPPSTVVFAAFSGDGDGNDVVNDPWQIVAGNLTQSLGAGEFVEVSLNNGASWKTAHASGTAWSLDMTELTGSDTLVARVTDRAGNHGAAFRQAYVLDQAAPTASVPASAQLKEPSGSHFTVTVTYADTGSGIDWSSISTGNIGVTAPGGAGLQVLGFAASGNVVSYTVQAPGGSWDTADAGSYTVAIRANSVRDNAGNYVAANAGAGTIEVVFSTAPAVEGLSLSDDTGSSAHDFVTNVQAQTIRATLSRALVAGDVVEGSLDNGVSWTAITNKVDGTALAWNGVALAGSGTIVIRVVDANGLTGATASHAFTLDQGVPAQTIATAAFSGDSGAAGDFVTNVAAQTLAGTLSAALAGDEFVEVSFNGGANWIVASASGTAWSVAGIMLGGSGILQVRVSDTAGNHGAAWEHAYLLDTTAPTAGTPVRADMIDPEGSSFTFTVTYADGGAGIDPASIGTGNVGVTGPGGALDVTNAAVSGNTATYTVQAPGGSWDAGDAGSYTISLLGAVRDLAGNAVAANADAHTFTVGTRPTATLSLDDTVLTAGETATLTIVFSEAVAGFGEADLAVANGSLSGLSSTDGGITWTATLTPAAGRYVDGNTVRLDLSGVQNAAGNPGAGIVQSDAYAVHTGAAPSTPGPGEDPAATDGNDVLTGTSGRDVLAGGKGDDALHGGAGDDVLQGGSSATGTWQFMLAADGTLSAQHGADALARADLDGGAADLAFLDADRAQLVDMALLYQAAFGRAPDVGGVGWYLEQGHDAAAVARTIVGSAEWAAQGMNGLSDNAFVQRLYRQVLERDGDAAGTAFWTAKLGEGSTTRADVLLAFAAAAEHRAAYAGGIAIAAADVETENGWIAGSGNDRLDGGAGSDLLVGGDGIDTAVYAGKLADYRFVLGAGGAIQVADKANADVDTLSGIERGEFADGTVDLAFTQADTATLTTLGLLYQAVLDRAGDLGGLSWWAGTGLQGSALVASFASSSEFVAQYGAMSDADFVAALYAHSGLAANAAGGSAAWVGMLHDHSRAEVVGAWIAQDAVLQAQSAGQGLWLA